MVVGEYKGQLRRFEYASAKDSIDICRKVVKNTEELYQWNGTEWEVIPHTYGKPNDPKGENFDFD